MSSSPKETIYNGITNAAWVTIPCTIGAVRKMVITEVPTAAQAATSTFTPQGLLYQRWDPFLLVAATGLRGGWGPTNVALPGEDIPVGDGMTVIGWLAQTVTGGQGPTLSTAARAADTPIQIQSPTATATQVRVREYNRGLTTA